MFSREKRKLKKEKKKKQRINPGDVLSVINSLNTRRPSPGMRVSTEIKLKQVTPIIKTIRCFSTVREQDVVRTH